MAVPSGSTSSRPREAPACPASALGWPSCPEGSARARVGASRPPWGAAARGTCGVTAHQGSRAPLCASPRPGPLSRRVEKKSGWCRPSGCKTETPPAPLSLSPECPLVPLPPTELPPPMLCEAPFRGCSGPSGLVAAIFPSSLRASTLGPPARHQCRYLLTCC